MKTSSDQGLRLSDLLFITAVLVGIAFVAPFALYEAGVGVNFWNQVGAVIIPLIDVIYTREGLASAAVIAALSVLMLPRLGR